MPVLLLTYDLNKERNAKGDYNKLYQVRDTYDYVRLSESCYALSTTETPQEVFEKLRAATALDDDDSVYLITLRQVSLAGQGPKGTNEWLGFHVQFR
jgi:hypothetical protein